MSADPELLMNGPEQAATTVALAHGAGVAMDAPFMDFFAKSLGERGYRTARFEFPYMARQRRTGQSSPPDAEPVLRATWLRVIELLGNNGLIIGGKSMGGRIASLVADEAKVAGLICLGYPFHPAGKPERLRVAHLEGLKTPTLIVQGQRDPFGSQADVARYTLSPAIQLHWITDGDHSFTPRKSAGLTEQQNWDNALQAIIAFLARLRD